jgi:hypothetical protein
VKANKGCTTPKPMAPRTPQIAAFHSGLFRARSRLNDGGFAFEAFLMSLVCVDLSGE